jgi:hypothetical protein
MAASHINGTPKRATPYTTSVDATGYYQSTLVGRCRNAHHRLGVQRRRSRWTHVSAKVPDHPTSNTTECRWLSPAPPRATVRDTSATSSPGALTFLELFAPQVTIDLTTPARECQRSRNVPVGA